MPKRATPTPPAIGAALRDIGRHLTDWRLLGGLTQAQVADRAGVSLMTLRRIEDGAGASLENVLRVARALGVLDGVVSSLDPMATDIGRARGLDNLPKRVRTPRPAQP